MGVLAEVEGEELETGTIIDLAQDLSDDEENSFNQLRRLPERLLERIGNDVERNRLLLDSILTTSCPTGQSCSSPHQRSMRTRWHRS